jgi:hypothetical protein
MMSIDERPIASKVTGPIPGTFRYRREPPVSTAARFRRTPLGAHPALFGKSGSARPKRWVDVRDLVRAQFAPDLIASRVATRPSLEATAQLLRRFCLLTTARLCRSVDIRFARDALLGFDFDGPICFLMAAINRYKGSDL